MLGTVKVTLRGVLLGVIFTLGGCGFFRQSVVSDRDVARQRAKIRKTAQYRNGYNAGYDAAKQELQKTLADNVAEMKALRNYRRLVYQGGIAAPQVVTVHRPAEISSDGQHYTSSKTESIIVRPAQFVDPGAMSSLLGKGRLYLYGVFDTPREAQSASESLAATIETGDSTAMLQTPRGRYAVVVKSLSGKNYEKEGFATAVGVVPKVPSPKQTIQAAKVDTNAPQRFADEKKPAAAPPLNPAAASLQAATAAQAKAVATPVTPVITPFQPIQPIYQTPQSSPPNSSN